jgi:hypothetical protein
MNLSADPWAGIDPRSPNVDQAAMAKRYGPHWQAGVSGPHSNVWEVTMQEAFAARKATWSVVYEEWDGIPTRREVDDARYSLDRRVLGLMQPPKPPKPEPPRPEPPEPEPPKPEPPKPEPPEPEPPKPEPPEPEPPKPEAIQVPDDIKETLRILTNAKGTFIIGPGRAARFQRLADWVLGLEKPAE